ncbi:MAG: hypothetical protein A2928_02645 [Candidatus Taylorbacteria bacterium RIFCSPLOWO2_01_FULL_45_15b]|uniref:DOD-type homing endonuclease domain-containing protein n=1 Tax=Candidatus Taylorbacteria bacterium RIFCSPLOWO2_01_FULL_45_15b TaxID=1802319 RepID=A0A1G2NFA2_9BACT|nr:MAG: hypothetical protein A2928_02645 [Candidatus Taylorbacteria bacterium RIFCSPLOWO2_01_FULL_45_15b]
MIKTGVIVGSSDTDFCEIFNDDFAFYILGLWCADGYHRTSSIGLSNVDHTLILQFRDFLAKIFPIERLRLRIYIPLEKKEYDLTSLISSGINKISYCKIKKAKAPTVHIYVNSRPLLRAFRKARDGIQGVDDVNFITAYFSGRFDGDGSVSSDGRKDCRIAYSTSAEATTDCNLLHYLGIKSAKVYHYAAARTYCIYISRYESERFLKNIREYS